MIELRNRKILRFNGKQHYISVPKQIIDMEILSIDEKYDVKFIPHKKK